MKKGKITQKQLKITQLTQGNYTGMKLAWISYKGIEISESLCPPLNIYRSSHCSQSRFEFQKNSFRKEFF